MSSMKRRFFLFGLINSLFSYSIFVGLGLSVAPAIAYGIGFASGVGTVFLLSNRFVFRGIASWKRNVAYAIIHIQVFAVGQLVIWLINPKQLSSLLLTSLVLICVNVIATYFGGRAIFLGRWNVYKGSMRPQGIKTE